MMICPIMTRYIPATIGANLYRADCLYSECALYNNYTECCSLAETTNKQTQIGCFK